VLYDHCHFAMLWISIFSERELTFPFAIYAVARPSVCRLSVYVICLSSVTFVRPI